MEKKFKDLEIGDKFWVYGDQFINYDYPKVCNCIKTAETRAREIDGVCFLVDECDLVTIGHVEV